MTKGSFRVVEDMFGHHHKNLRVVMLKVELHHGSSRVVELKVGLQHGYLGSEQGMF